MQQYRLLLVDDDATDRRVIRKLFAELGNPDSLTQEADSGASGLAALSSGSFDCVLLDFNLPDMTGLEFLAAAAGEGGLPCGVVLVTGQGNEAIAVDVMKCGAHDYLVKGHLNANNLWRGVTRAVTQIELQRRLAVSLRDLTDANLALEQEIATRRAAEADLLAAKDAAEQANMAKTRFVAMISHELRTPLNGIMGYAQLLEVEGGLSTRQTAHVGTMKQASRSLLELIERLLDFSSIESGRMKLCAEEALIRDLAEQCIAAMSPLATDRRLRLRMVQSHDCPRQIITDPARLRQVLINLLGNALKYTDVGSVELRLLAGASPGSLRVEIADTGHGVSEANRDRLFVDFERFDAATSVEGTGMGLAIAARIVGLMGGKIGYHPNPDGVKPNSGSVFWFELPPGEIPSPAVPSAPVSVAPSLPGQRVLLVDDILINRDIIGDFLKAAGHMVTLANSGAEAIRLAGEQQFDLILMDVRMPEMDGLEATRRIRALPGAHGQIPILALTAHTFPDQVAQCREATMNAHISKPVDYHTLIDAIEWAIRGGEPTGDTPATPSQTASTPGGRPRAQLDRTVLSRLFALLPRDEIVVILHSLRERQQEMLRLMDQEATPAVLAEVAHALTSTASIFGFVTLAARARDYECALTQNDPQTGQSSQDLRAEIGVALPTLNAIMCEIQVQPILFEGTDRH